MASRLPFRNWSDIYPELIEVILQKLSLIDILRFEAVCSLWSSAVKSYVSSPSFGKRVDRAPWLMHPTVKDDLEEESDGNSHCFYNLSEKRVYRMKNTDDGNVGGRWCVGSSFGWLVMWNKKTRPYLLNPFTKFRIELPSSLTLFTGEGDDDGPVFDGLINNCLYKAIITADPSRTKSFEVVIIYGFSSSLAYWKYGGSSWADISGGYLPYCDIICHENLLYALKSKPSIEIWDLRGVSPMKVAEITSSYHVVELFPRFTFYRQFYLVKSEEDLLFVIRFVDVGENEPDRRGYENSNPSACPHRTLCFRVYKLDFLEQRCEGVQSLGNRILFLGGNHSVSIAGNEIPECEEDSIYFTEDVWRQDGLHGCYDTGFYNMKDGCIKPFCPCIPQKVSSPPIFIFPNPF